MRSGSQPVRIPSGSVELDGDLFPPAPARGVVVFAHGSGSGRKSPRNRTVSDALLRRGFGTLLLDLLERREAQLDERTGQYRFDIPRLTERLLAATDWLSERPGGDALPIGYFGASTGGAVALRAAAERPRVVRAAVLRGARSDLADAEAPRVRCATLILVGSLDEDIRKLNERTMSRLPGVKELVVVEGASHLFEEPGTLEEVAERSVDWFARHLA
jgi:dienelactone hydrolase